MWITGQKRELLDIPFTGLSEFQNRVSHDNKHTFQPIDMWKALKYHVQRMPHVQSDHRRKIRNMLKLISQLSN